MASARVVVVGGGISGLSAAHALLRQERARGTAVDVTVLEAANDVGGKLATQVIDGVSVDAGAESVQVRRPEAVSLIADVGLTGEQVPQDQSGVGVWVDGSLHRLPPGQVLGIPYDPAAIASTDLLDPSGVAELERDQAMPPPHIEGDISVGDLVRARMGEQVVDRLVEPLLGGVYAGHADQISVDMALPGLLENLRSAPTLMAGVEATRTPTEPGQPLFVSLRGGLGRLPRAVVDASGITVHQRMTAHALQRSADGWTVLASSPDSDHEFTADAVILACPAWSTRGLLAPHVEPAALGALELGYASVALVTLVFRGDRRPELPAGSGFLVPPGKPLAVKAATFASQKWQWLREAYPDTTIVRVSMGRYGEGDLMSVGDDDLMTIALQDFQEITATEYEPEATAVKRWSMSLPQYQVGHRSRVQRLRTAVAQQPPLEVCGAAFDGVGVPACIASGQAAADRVMSHLGVGRE